MPSWLDHLKKAPLALALINPIAGGAVIGLLVLYALVTYALAPFFVRGPAAGATEAEFHATLDREVPHILDRYHIPGVAIGTVLHGDPGQVYAYGLADVRSGRPMKPDTVFQVASISKSVSAWGVLALVDAGKISLDQPVQRYLKTWPLPASPYPAEAVTVRSLLTHTSGLNAGEDEFRKPDERAATPTELLAREGHTENGSPTPARLVAPAGSSFTYSVPGYTLLQMLIEDQSGKPFARFMRDAVLRPLGMTGSSYGWDPALRAGTATPYMADGRAREVLVPQDAAADGLFSTAGDLTRFLAAPLPGEGLPVGAGVLSQRTVDQLFLRPDRREMSQIILIGPEAPCLGCFLERNDGGPVVVTNAGNDPGWSAQVNSVPATGDGLVVLMNSSRGAPAIAQIAGIWAAWRGLPAPQMTRSFRTVGGYAVLIVGLVTFSAIAGGLGWANGVVVGERRFASFQFIGIFQSLLEWGLASGLSYLWFLLQRVIDLLPTFAMISKIVLACLVLVVLLRTIFPRRLVDR